MPPLKKGDVRAALDKRIVASRRKVVKLQSEAPEVGVSVPLAEERGRERALQAVRNELFGERLPKGPKKA